MTVPLREGYLIFEDFWEMQKGTQYHKTSKECREIRKIKILMQAIWLLTYYWVSWYSCLPV